MLAHDIIFIGDYKMKVQSASTPQKSNIAKELDSKLRDKFGDKFLRANEKNEMLAKKKAAQEQEKLELSHSARKGESKEDHLLKSDVENNDPNAEVTRGKLKDLLRSGGFNFNPKERKALSQILNVK